jgi:hypothetical protein
VYERFEPFFIQHITIHFFYFFLTLRDYTCGFFYIPVLHICVCVYRNRLARAAKPKPDRQGRNPAGAVLKEYFAPPPPSIALMFFNIFTASEIVGNGLYGLGMLPTIRPAKLCAQQDLLPSISAKMSCTLDINLQSKFKLNMLIDNSFTRNSPNTLTTWY